MIEVHVTPNYPKDCTDAELQRFISLVNIALYKCHDTILIQKYSYVLQIGLAELQNRENKRSEMISKRYSYLGLLFTIIAVTLSAISVYYSNKDDKADTIWMQNQIKEYQKMNNTLIEINKKLDKPIVNNNSQNNSNKQDNVNKKKLQ